MLVLDAAGLDRQRDEIAFFPVVPFAVRDRVAFPFQYINGHAPLVAVLAGLAANLLRKNPPLLEHGVGIHIGVKKIADSSLTGVFPGTIFVAHDDRSRAAALQHAILILNRRLIGIFRGLALVVIRHKVSPRNPNARLSAASNDRQTVRVWP